MQHSHYQLVDPHCQAVNPHCWLVEAHCLLVDAHCWLVDPQCYSLLPGKRSPVDGSAFFNDFLEAPFGTYSRTLRGISADCNLDKLFQPNLQTEPHMGL